MELQLIRNATLRLRYNGRLILIDPFLAPKHTLEMFAGIAPNPLVDLPCKPEEVVEGVEMVVVSHLHVDHFDEVARELLPKKLPLLCQPGDAETIRGYGFGQVKPVEEGIEWEGIRIRRSAGQHGKGMWRERMGEVSGFVFEATGEPTLYWMGDTIWCRAVEEVIKEVKPELIVTHSSGAKFEGGSPIVMDATQTAAVCRAAPNATVIATHMESLDHGTVSRAELRATALAGNLPPERLLIPEDGETQHF